MQAITKTKATGQFRSANQEGATMKSFFFLFVVLASVALCLLVGLQEVECGGKKKGGEDIILYNGHILMRGDKEGGNIVLGGSNSNEEVEFMPSMFGEFGGMGGMGARRRR